MRLSDGVKERVLHEIVVWSLVLAQLGNVNSVCILLFILGNIGCRVSDVEWLCR